MTVSMKTDQQYTSERNLLTYTAAIAASRKLFVLILSFSLLKFSFRFGLSRDLEEVNRHDGRLLFPVGRHQERLGRGHQKSVSPFVLQFRKKTHTHRYVINIVKVSFFIVMEERD